MTLFKGLELPLLWAALIIAFFPAMVVGRPYAVALISISLPASAVYPLGVAFFTVSMLAATLLRDRSRRLDSALNTAESDKWVGWCLKRCFAGQIVGMSALAIVPTGNWMGLIFVCSRRGSIAMRLTYVTANTLALLLSCAIPFRFFLAGTVSLTVVRIATDAEKRQQIKISIVRSVDAFCLTTPWLFITLSTVQHMLAEASEQITASRKWQTVRHPRTRVA